MDIIGDIKAIEAWLEEHFGTSNVEIVQANATSVTLTTMANGSFSNGSSLVANVVVSNTVAQSIKPTLIHNTWPTQAQCPSYYGNPASSGWSHANLVDVPCPWTLHMDNVTLHNIQIHRKAADSLRRILQYIWVEAGETQEAIEKLHYDRYSGSFNFRPIRGSSGRVLSMHSYGAAIDFDDQENQQHSEKHLFQDNSLIVEAFKAEGWVWGGDWSRSSIDAMHFQAARVFG